MVDLDGIKNIFFDLGGVLLDIDFSKTFEAFEAMGVVDAHKLNEREDVSQLFKDFECGRYSKDEFFKLFRSLIGAGHPADSQITEAFCALLRDYIPENIELVQRLSKDYRVFLLSNTNALHAVRFNAVLKRDFGIPDMDHLMERAFYSHDLGFRKPDIRIFEKVIELAGVVASESLFFDDLPDNVAAARTAGMQAILVDSHPLSISEAKHS